MANIEVIKNKINGFVGKYPAINDPLTKAADTIKVDKAFIVIGVALLPVLIAALLGFGEFIIDLVGFVYPMYKSIKAIEANTHEDDALWLSYWLIFGLFKVVEEVTDFIFYDFNFYYLAKVAFLVWSFYPSTKGAFVIYNTVLKPYVVPHILGTKSD